MLCRASHVLPCTHTHTQTWRSPRSTQASCIVLHADGRADRLSSAYGSPCCQLIGAGACATRRDTPACSGSNGCLAPACKPGNLIPGGGALAADRDMARLVAMGSDRSLPLRCLVPRGVGVLLEPYTVRNHCSSDGSSTIMVFFSSHSRSGSDTLESSMSKLLQHSIMAL